jgi:hypothetical protein
MRIAPLAALACAALLAGTAAYAASRAAEITDMTVSRGGLDKTGTAKVWMIDSIGQDISGLSFGSSSATSAELADGYRFPVQLPIITNVACLRGSHAIRLDWLHDVDLVYAGRTNAFLPDGACYAATADETTLPAACVRYEDAAHTNQAMRVYRVAFEDEFAEEIVGKMTRPLVLGWNLCSLPFMPVTNTLAFVINDQLPSGSLMTAPYTSVVYTPSAHTNIVVPHFYLGGGGANEWLSLEPPLLAPTRAFYIRLQRAMPMPSVTFAGFVPQTPVDMGPLPRGWTLVAQPYPADVHLDDTDLWAAGLVPGVLTTNGHTGDALYSQRDGDKNALVAAFLQAVPGQLYPTWVGPMEPYLRPAQGYWTFVQPDHPGSPDWLYGLPYFITPIEF